MTAQNISAQFTVCYNVASQHLAQCGSSLGLRENSLTTIYYKQHGPPVVARKGWRKAEYT